MIYGPDYIKPFIDQPIVKILCDAAENQQFLK